VNDNDNAGFSEEIVEPDAEGSGVNLEDFIAYPPTHVYPAARFGSPPVSTPACLPFRY